MMDEQTYRADPRPSITQLEKLDRMTPAHARIEWAKPPSTSMELGTALHARVLMPSQYADLVQVRSEPINPRTGNPYGPGTKAHDEWVAENAASGVTVITPKEAEIVEAMAASIAGTHAAALLRMCNIIEQPLFGTIGGVECRGRPDAICTKAPGRVVVDIKTTRNPATRSEFAKSIGNYGYGFQAAGYTLLAEQSLGFWPKHFVFIVVENQPPYAAAGFRLDDAVVAYYCPRVEAAARLYAKCVASGEWPAHPQEIQDIGLPKWHEGAREL